jgi:predicted NAD/FAD-binding protein
VSRIAIVGSGIAGMTAAWHLHRDHDVVVYESNDYVGGHTATKDVEWAGQRYAIDTGFIVFNDWTYPNFIALLQATGTAWQWSDMSFSLSCERSGLEYNGTSIDSLFAQRRNALNPRFLRMIADILRFNQRCRALLQQPDTGLTLGEYLTRERYSRAFVEQYILPMGRAIWSASGSGMLDFPARFFVDFFERHGFLNINDRPTWRTVTGGSREYARRLTAGFSDRIRLATPVGEIRRDAAGVTIIDRQGHSDRFDAVFIACHSDQALRMLAEPSNAEREILTAFPYQANTAILHRDERVLPRTPRARAAWNYHLRDPDTEKVALTYDMNVLQSLDAPCKFLVTLNREDIDPDKIHGRYVYDHPVYTPAAVAAQARRSEISGQQHTYYCGAYWRYGFHEDGVVSALWALQDLARASNTPTAAPVVLKDRAARP